jgi:mannose-1-phosphate guanylyltransferase
VVVGAAHADLVRAQVPEVEVVVEPGGRNTAAAIALALLATPGSEDDVMAVLPADHLIRDEAPYRDVLRAAERLAHGAFGVDRPLVTLGIEPDRPATDYGYLVPDPPGREVDGLEAFRLAAFREKPDIEAARALLRTSGVAWNAGMFLWQRGAIRDALTRHTDLPLMSEAALRAAYPSLTTRSIDYEVMEPAARAGHVLMASMDVGWTDIGGWTALLEAIDAGGSGRVIEAGERVDLAAGDLLVRGSGRELSLHIGPGTIAVDAPSAHLVGADRDRVQALLDRVAQAEGPSA